MTTKHGTLYESQRKYYWKNREAILAKQRKIKKPPYAERSEKEKATVKTIQKRIRAQRYILLGQIKMHYGCTNPKCRWVGDFESEMLDYHHVNPDEKTNTIGMMANRKLSTLCKEIRKCCILCANCHRQLTWGSLDCSQFKRCNVNDEGYLIEPHK